MASAPPTEIVIDLGPSRGPITFRSSAEIVLWLQRETAVWAWLGNTTDIPYELRNELDPIRQGLVTSLQRATQLNDNSAQLSPEKRTELTQAIAAVLKETYAVRNTPLSSEPEGQLIMELAKRSGYACLTAYMALRPTRTFQDVAMIEGYVRGHTLRLGLGDAPEKSRKVWDEIILESRSTLDSTKREMLDAVSRLADLQTKTEKDHADKKLAFDAQLDHQMNQFNLLIDGTKESFTTLQRVYNEQMALQEPVNYWRSKRNTHRRWVAGLAVATLGAGGGALKTLHVMLRSLLDVSHSTSTSQIGANPPLPAIPDHPPLWELGFLVVVALLLLWGIRILVRALLSQMHLALDASQRIVLTQTYLSLIRGGHVAEASDRTLILRNLFRPTATGIIRDDAIPPTPAGELLNRATGGL